MLEHTKLWETALNEIELADRQEYQIITEQTFDEKIIGGRRKTFQFTFKKL